MTTIAYKDGVIAYDSRVTARNLIVDDEFDKHLVVAGIHFFCSGTTEFLEDFCNAYAAHSPTVRYMEVSALVVEAGNRVFKSSVEEENSTHRIWKSPIRVGSLASIGSGQDFVLAYMDMGLSAEEAVRRVMKFDAATGGEVRTFRIEGHGRD